MQLIGMLDSPYVRRVAIALQLLGLPFEHRALSVFRTYDQFRAINPVVKAPTLVCDDGTVLMDSTLILDYAEHLPGARRPLLPADLDARRHALRVLGLALAATEKSVQLIYETQLRPAERQHAPWIERVTQQLGEAFAALESEVARTPLAAGPDTIDLAGITAGVAWTFARALTPEAVPVARHPELAGFAAHAEALAAFRAAPHGPGTVGA